MKIGLIDVIDWQAMVDFRDGRPVTVEHPLLGMAAEVIDQHPYPGDLVAGASKWVTDVALDMNNRYQPEFMLLNYANIYFGSVFMPPDKTAHAAQIREVFDEIQRFVEASGFTPVIVGLGDLVSRAGYINIVGLDGMAVAGGISAQYAGLYGASPRDLSSMASHPGVERIVTRDAFRAQFGGAPEFYSRFPDHLLVAREGYVFRGVGSGARRLYQVPKFDPYIPVHTSLGEADSITDVSGLVLQALRQRKVALILVEGVGCETFPLSFRPLSNAYHWHCYTMGDGQYLALTTGQHFVEYPYPPGYRYYVDDAEDKPYPFSGIFAEMPPHTIGQRYPGKSVAVGSRGILTHIIAGTDITIECFVRALYNHGVMAVVEI